MKLGFFVFAAGLLSLSAAAAPPAPFTDALRGPVPIAEETKPPLLYNTENKDIRRTRAYTMQPPTIPHKTDGYQVDKNVNRCLFCHARTRAEEAQAIPVSVTHYQDRDGNTLAEISPRRYFCEQCHVTQAEAKPLVTNTFIDVEALLRGEGAQKPAKKK